MVFRHARMKWVCSCLLFLPVLVACSGCTPPPHYSVSVAQGPTHTTFAQRNLPGSGKDDYLVDCKHNPDGTLYDCYVVKLPQN